MSTGMPADGRARPHRILLQTLVIDVPAHVHEQTRTFWTLALAARARRGQRFPEFHVLEHAAALGTVMVQDIGDAPARVHLDIESDDVEAEVIRLVGAGAVEIERHDEWVVLRDPAGLLFCVVPGEGDDFAANATEVS
jgi:Glyoxalase-like domain